MSNIATYRNDYNAGQRTLRPGGERYDRYFARPKGKTVRLRDSIITVRTVEDIKTIVRETLSQTAAIAQVLKGRNVAETLQNVHEFLYWNIQYKNDKEGFEQLREPVVSWAERHTGIDCDCFTIFASSILSNLGIPHAARVVGYRDDLTGIVGGWQHIYVIVPTGSGRAYFTLDAVLYPFNYEKPPGKVNDSPIILMPTERLSGVTGSSPALDELRVRIERERDRVQRYPDAISDTYNPTDFVNAANFVLTNWNDPARRDAALARMADLERRHNELSGAVGLSGWQDEYQVELGATAPRKSTQIARQAPQTQTKQPEAPRKFFTAVKEIVQDVKAAADKNGDGKINLKEIPRAAVLVAATPALAVSRRATRALIRLNLFQIATKLASKPAAQADAEAYWKRTGGDVDGLRKAIRAGVETARKHGKNVPVSGLGEPVTAAGLVALATPVVMELLSVLQKNGLIDKVPEEDAVKKVLSENSLKIFDFFKKDTDTDGGDNTQNEGGDKQNKPGDDQGRKENGTTEEPGFMEKVQDFVTENPGTTVAIIGGAAGLGLLLAAGGSDKPKRKKSDGLSGTGKRKTTTKKKDGTYVLS